VRHTIRSASNVCKIEQRYPHFSARCASTYSSAYPEMAQPQRSAQAKDPQSH
jgi:hypothetical protein